jgi:hypothetical protein
VSRPQDRQAREDDAQGDHDHADEERLADLAGDAQHDAADRGRVLAVLALAEGRRADAVLPGVERDAHVLALGDDRGQAVVTIPFGMTT